MADIIQLRRDTQANWSNVNPILFLGELGIEIDTQRHKIGNGIDNWSSLGYSRVFSNEVICQATFSGFLSSSITLTEALATIDQNSVAVNSLTFPEFHIPFSNGTALNSSSDFIWDGTGLIIDGNIDWLGIASGDGSGLENLNASNVSQGILNVSRMGTGSPDITYYLRGDGSWQVLDNSHSHEYLPLVGGIISGDLSVAGNLIINGTSTTVNSATVTIDNPIFTLGGNEDPTVNDSKDRGIEFRYFDASAKRGFFGRDDSTGYFVYIPDAVNVGEVFSGIPGDFQATNFRGALIGNADTASKLATGREINMTGDVTWSSGNFDGSLNVTGVSTLSNTGVLAGTYNNSITSISPFTVDSKGRITGVGASIVISPDWSNVTGKPSTISGYGITDAQPLDSDLTAIGSLSGTGYLRKTAVDTWILETSFDGNATTASALQTARSISLIGDVTGSVNFDGSANVSINTLVNFSALNYLPITGGTLTGSINIIDSTNEQLKLSYNALNFSTFTVDSVGDLEIACSGDVIRFTKDIEMIATRGIILHSPNGTPFRVTVQNNGELIISTI